MTSSLYVCVSVCVSVRLCVWGGGPGAPFLAHRWTGVGRVKVEVGGMCGEWE